MKILFLTLFNILPLTVPINTSVIDTTKIGIGSISEMFEASNIIANLGIMIVISTLFIYIFYTFFRRMEAQNEKMFDKILSQHSDEIKDHDDKMQIRISMNDKINNLLNVLIAKTSAERAYIYEFHNSGLNFTGLPFAKFSMTYEVMSKNNSHVITEFQNMPLSCLGSIVTNLPQFKPIIVDNIEEFKNTNPIVYGFLTARNTETYIYIGLKDSYGHIFAMLALNFTKENLEAEDIDELYENIENTANSIETLLDIIKQ